MRFSSPSPLPIVEITVGPADAAVVGAVVGPLVAALLGPLVGAAVPLGDEHAATTIAATAMAAPILRWNMPPPLSAVRVTPGRGARAVASRPAARVAPVR